MLSNIKRYLSIFAFLTIFLTNLSVTNLQVLANDKESKPANNQKITDLDKRKPATSVGISLKSNLAKKSFLNKLNSTPKALSFLKADKLQTVIDRENTTISAQDLSASDKLIFDEQRKYFALEFKEGQDSKKLVDYLRTLPEVETAFINSNYYLHAYNPDGLNVNQWQLEDANNGINMPSSWEIMGQKLVNNTNCATITTNDKNCSGDKAVKVAILDTGVNKNALPGTRFDEANSIRYYAGDFGNGSCGNFTTGGTTTANLGDYLCVAKGPGVLTESPTVFRSSIYCTNYTCSTFNEINVTTPDRGGHGTAVASVIAMADDTTTGIGIASNTSILSVGLQGVRYGDDYGFGISEIDIINGLNYAVSQNVDVVNMSFGGNYIANYSGLESVIQDAVNKGIILVASSGNSGYSDYNYPASFGKVISVGAIDNNLVKTDYSTYNDKVDITAPVDMNSLGLLARCGDISITAMYPCFGGTNIGDYSYWNGTSFSAPQVTAVAALMKSVDKNITPSQFDAKLKATSDKINEQGVSFGLNGAGKMNVCRLLDGCGGSTFVPSHYFPWYATNDKNQTWTLVGNPSTTEIARVTIKIAGVNKGTYTVPAGGRITPYFAGILDGPVEVSSDIPVYTTQRIHMEINGDYSFNEYAGIPN
jgi:subtilisin family serine protease